MRFMQKVFISKNKSLGTTQMTINSKVVEYFWYHPQTGIYIADYGKTRKCLYIMIW